MVVYSFLTFLSEIGIGSQTNDPACHGDSNGKITLSATGGTGIYTYSVCLWKNIENFEFRKKKLQFDVSDGATLMWHWAQNVCDAKEFFFY